MVEQRQLEKDAASLRIKDAKGIRELLKAIWTDGFIRGLEEERWLGTCNPDPYDIQVNWDQSATKEWIDGRD